MGLVTATEIRQNYEQVLDEIDRAARRAGRNPDEIQIVVVTKFHPIETIRAVIESGIAVLGENYPEEGLAKMQTLNFSRPAWHMIGHVQSRKADIVAAHYDYLHSLDSLKLAVRLDRFAGQAGRRLPVLLECNVSGEESKSGYAAWDESAWPALAEAFAQIAALPNLSLCGLMTVAPYANDPQEARPYFRKLAALRNFLTDRLPGVQLDQLSMGMSGDFETAVEEGATWVRIGTRILGPRQKA